MLSGKPTGPWTYYFDNGKTESTGTLEGEEKAGKWKYYTRSGRLLEVVDHDQSQASASGTAQE